MASSQSLANLPVEILTHICKMFCHHCSYNIVHWKHDEGERPECVKALYDLSLTCRTLRAIAQPILYHEPHTNTELKLLLTLAARPDLASQVREIILASEGRTPPDPSNEELALIRAAGAQFGATIPDPLQEDFALRFSELLLLLVPDVEDVSFRLEYSESEGAPSLITTTDAAFESLRHLHLSHWDTEGGFSLSDANHLLDAAPNLEYLTLHMCIGVESDVSLERVRALRFTWGYLESDDVANAIEACPRLERFYYESGGSVVGQYGGDDEFLPSDLMRALQTRKATLKHLGLDFTYLYQEIRDESMEEDELFGSFADFPLLETLIVPLHFLFTEEEIDGGYNSEAAVALLPKSLRFLGLVGETDRDFEGPVALAVAIERGDFPHLKKVVLSAGDGETERLTAIFAAVGVEYEKYAWGRHDLPRESWSFR